MADGTRETRDCTVAKSAKIALSNRLEQFVGVFFCDGVSPNSGVAHLQ